MIAQSHSGFGQLPTLAEAEAAGARFARTAGAFTIAALRAMALEDLEPALRRIDPYPAGPSAVVDGWYLPADLNTIFSAGQQNDVPLLTGSTNDERSAVGPLISFDRDLWLRLVRNLRANTVAEYRSWVGTVFGGQADDYLKLYPAESDAAVSKALHDLGRDSVLATHWTWAQLQAKTGKSKVYLYLFSHAPPVASTPGVMAAIKGAVHNADIMYVFNNLRLRDLPWTDTDRRMADVMSSYWTNFAKKGDPNGPGLPQWSSLGPNNPLGPNKEELMNIGDPPGMQGPPNKAGVEFLAAFQEQLRQAGNARHTR